MTVEQLQMLSNLRKELINDELRTKAVIERLDTLNNELEQEGDDRRFYLMKEEKDQKENHLLIGIYSASHACLQDVFYVELARWETLPIKELLFI